MGNPQLTNNGKLNMLRANKCHFQKPRFTDKRLVSNVYGTICRSFISRSFLGIMLPWCSDLVLTIGWMKHDIPTLDLFTLGQAFLGTNDYMEITKFENIGHHSEWKSSGWNIFGMRKSCGNLGFSNPLVETESFVRRRWIIWSRRMNNFPQPYLRFIDPLVGAHHNFQVVF